MSNLLPYIGDVYKLFPDQPYWAGLILITCSTLCGMIVGLEREARAKPAGVRTVTLICMGSTIFTLASLLMAQGAPADRARIAAQVVTGIGFLGAGAIIRDRGAVVGMTTGATIWTVAAIGVLIGIGYATAGLVLTFIVVGMLMAFRLLERRLSGQCAFSQCRLLYDPDGGKTRLLLLTILDEYRVSERAYRVYAEAPLEMLEIHYCLTHRDHRLFLADLIKVAAIKEIQYPPVLTDERPAATASMD
ncbi:MAG: MgtC/SapB family protein [Phycisphaerales bacterium]|nr:MgtC/SapB family protein [Phycisphaerales bacterium]